MAACIVGTAVTMVATALTLRWMLHVTGTPRDPDSPLLWLTVTVLVYLAALWLYTRSGGHSLVNPILLSVAGLVGVLHFTATPYPVYFEGAKFVHFLIGP
eukprot:gene58119-79599_t